MDSSIAVSGFPDFECCRLDDTVNSRGDIVEILDSAISVVVSLCRYDSSRNSGANLSENRNNGATLKSLFGHIN